MGLIFFLKLNEAKKAFILFFADTQKLNKHGFDFSSLNNATIIKKRIQFLLAQKISLNVYRSTVNEVAPPHHGGGGGQPYISV